MQPNYKKSEFNLKKCVSDLQNVCIWRTKCVHLAYKMCASDLQKVCIHPTSTAFYSLGLMREWVLSCQWAPRNDLQSLLICRMTSKYCKTIFVFLASSPSLISSDFMPYVLISACCFYLFLYYENSKYISSYPQKFKESF